MLPRPPSSPLFPYTTLFRSRHAVGFLEKTEGYRCDVVVDLDPTSPLREADDIEGCLHMLADEKADVVIDRKSTRLNSSHTVISYAVFCLKKKKKIRNITNKK